MCEYAIIAERLDRITHSVDAHSQAGTEHYLLRHKLWLFVREIPLPVHLYRRGTALTLFAFLQVTSRFHSSSLVLPLSVLPFCLQQITSICVLGLLEIVIEYWSGRELLLKNRAFREPGVSCTYSTLHLSAHPRVLFLQRPPHQKARSNAFF